MFKSLKRINNLSQILNRNLRFNIQRSVSNNQKLPNNNNEETDYQTVPHYNQKSALYIKSPSPSSENKANDQVFPKIISPELKMAQMFESKDILKSLLNLNLTARHFHLNLVQLQNDYFKMRDLEIKVEEYNKEKTDISNQINNLVKSNLAKGVSKKDTMQSTQVKELIKAGNNLKLKINNLLEDLLPLQEIVNIACLRLPNYLHFSSLYLHSVELNREKVNDLFIQSDLEQEENTNKILFEFNIEAKKDIKNKISLLDGTSNWEYLLNDSIICDSKEIKSKYYKKDMENWSFIEQTDIDSVLHNRYLVGTYSKLEQCLINYFFDKIQNLNDTDDEDELINFEHVKSVSMFKSAIVEGSGKKFNDFRNLFNVVRFSKSPGDSKKPDSYHTNIELLHLTGTSSICSLVLNFVRTKIKSEYLPWTVFTNGKSYSPKLGQINSFDFLTLTEYKSSYLFDYDHQTKSKNDHLTDEFLRLILNNGKAYLTDIKKELNDYLNMDEKLIDNVKQFKHINKKLDQIFVNYLKMFVYCLKDFKNIPVRFVCINPHDLNVNESFKIKVEAYLPSEQNYVTIGEVCLLNDYISSRLQIRINNENSKQDVSSSSSSDSIQHVNMIYCRLIDINVFTQILIESNLIKSNQNDLLDNSKLFEANLSFVLPEYLKKFYMF